MKLLEQANTPLQVIAARKKKSDHPLADTPFHRAFLQYDGLDIDEDFSAAYAAYAIGNAGLKHTVIKAVYGDSVPVRPKAFSITASDKNWEDFFETEATSLLSASRLRKKGSRAIVLSIPVGRMVLPSLHYPDPRWSTVHGLTRSRQTITDIVSRLQASKFRALLTVDKALDVTLSADEVLALTPPAEYEGRTADLGNPDFPALFAQCFTKFRFLRAPLSELASSDRKAQGFGQRFGSHMPFDELSVEHESFVANDEVASEALNYMLSFPVVGFIECELADDFVQKLTGKSVADVPMSLIGNWLIGTLEFQWGTTDDDTIGDVSEVSSLSMARDESETSPTLAYDPAESNPHRLCVDNEGKFYYLPKVDVVDEYEAELETLYTTDKGEWVISDVTNPTNTLRITDEEGRERRIPRKVQPNRILYTDFKTGLLSYSNYAGILSLHDISSFRSLNNAHIKEFLDHPLLKGTIANKVFLDQMNRVARASAQRFGGQIVAPHEGNPLRLEEAFVPMLNGKWQEYLGGRMPLLTGYLADTALAYYSIPGLPQELMDELLDARFGNISPNSQIPELRAVYELFRLYAEDMLRNFDVVAADSRVISALTQVGMMQMLVQYAPQREHVEAAAREETAPYTEEPEDYRTVEIPEIPFTRGVTLMPHQVKIFAKLKKFPRRFTLDVAAGGGKTFTAVLVCLMYMKHNGIRKPLVLCPNILLKNYFEDATYATAGGVNVIAINSDTLNRWGPERLKELIDKAPPNTVVVASFDSMAKGNRRVYATASVQQNAVTEFLKQFDFDMVVTDESHRLKRTGSNTNRNAARITARAKVTGVMTGTLVFDTPKDVVGQFNLMDPSIFGSDSFFDERYLEAGKGGIKRAKFGASKQVKDRIKSATAYVQVQRKEWAALLPPRIDEVTGEPSEVFHILNTGKEDDINMTEAQQAYYDLLLNEVRQKIMEDAQNDASLQRVLRAMQTGELDNAEEDDELMDELMTKLNPYLARLEIYLANPVNSREVEFTSRLTDPQDRISPKAKKVAEICRRHIERGYVGKILVFTQYNESAEGIYENLPTELKNLAVHYTSADKTPLMQFQSDPTKVILVGNERSIGTGLNLQMASRIIRTESTWNWGALEQAESRVNRPVPKSKEIRNAIYLDWIITNRTIDVTKMGRMISKAVESYKFNGAGNPAFDNMEALEPVKMTLENVLLRNDIEDDTLGMLEHFEAYQLCRQLEEQEFQAFRRDPNVRTEGYVLNGGILPGSGILKNVPYVPGIVLYGKEQLGLVPFIQYVADVHSTLQQFEPNGLVIHTEDGDGTCTGFRRNSKGDLSSVTVELPDGSKATYDLASVFVVTKAGVDVDTRRQVAEAIMTEHLQRPVEIAPQAPLAVPPTEEEEQEDPTPNKGRIKLLRNKPVPNADKKANALYEMYALSVGHIYTLAADTEDPDVPQEVLEDQGFERIRPYHYAQMKNPQQLEEWFTKAQKVTQFTKESAAQIREMIDLMKSHKPGTFFQAVTPTVLRDFWRDQRKPPKAGQTTAFVSIEDNGEGRRPLVYVIAFLHQNPQFRTVASRARVAGVEWDHQTADQLWYMARNQKDAIAKAKAVNAVSPIKNFNKLVTRLSQLRPTPAK